MNLIERLMPKPQREVIEIDGVHNINSKEAEEVLNRAVIQGGPVYLKGNKMLTFKDIRKEGLDPKFKIEIPETRPGSNYTLRSVWLSVPYWADDRPAYVQYVEANDGSNLVGTAYLSGSQGLWRYLPFYNFDGDDKQLSNIHLGKGSNEANLNHPFELQKAMSEIGSKMKPLMPKNYELIFFGTTHELSYEDFWFFRKGHLGYLDTQKEQIELVKLRKEKPNQFIQNVETSPWIQLIGMFGEASENEPRIAPEELDFDIEKLKTWSTKRDDRPDLANSYLSWNLQSTVYGKIQAEVYFSRDRRLLYQFNQDCLGRAWVATVQQTQGGLSATGLRTTPVRAGQLLTPAYEYEGYDDGYGNPSIKNGPYVDMFTNYLSKVPVIQEYFRSKKAISSNP